MNIFLTFVLGPVLALILLVVIMLFLGKDAAGRDRGNNWTIDSLIPGETFRSFAMRSGIPHKYLKDVCAVRSVLGSECEPHTVFASFLAENVDDYPDLLGDLNVMTKFAATRMQEADWQYYIRTPRVWNEIQGDIDYVLNKIEDTYFGVWAGKKFDIYSYEGPLLDL